MFTSIYLYIFSKLFKTRERSTLELLYLVAVCVLGTTGRTAL